MIETVYREQHQLPQVLKPKQYDAENYWQMPDQPVESLEVYGHLGRQQKQFLTDVKHSPERYGFEGTPQEAAKLAVAAAYLEEENYNGVLGRALEARRYGVEMPFYAPEHDAHFPELDDVIDTPEYYRRRSKLVLKPIAARLEQRARQLSDDTVAWELNNGMNEYSIMRDHIRAHMEQPLAPEMENEEYVKRRLYQETYRDLRKILKKRPDGMDLEELSEQFDKRWRTRALAGLGMSNVVSFAATHGMLERSVQGDVVYPTTYVTNPRESEQYQMYLEMETR